MKLRFAAAFVCTLLAAAQARGEEAVAARALSGDEILLQDGRTLRLAGIKGVAGAQEILAAALGKPLELANTAPDRYGRVVALAAPAGAKENLQDDLLRAGAAFVYPAAGGDAPYDAFFAEERAARAAHRGYWAAHPDTPATDAGGAIGSYAFVAGKVVAAARVKNRFYLNFGADWHTDFTAAIAAHDLRGFKKAGVDLQALAGKTVRVRGWVRRDFGPMIMLSDPRQLEILG